ncbi:uncharacterized protein LOC112091182 [Morus notabilis]|uniref:uncharacterized protein LOC112091182 n=1 Tax=Morus notabilis TaxID=981085 RepID=UPI000CED11BF|nr:uncharacterized protein LOC112091182 [Morus notabilis]
MPFGLKNARATYERLVNKMFALLLSKSMEVYVDDMLVKSAKATQNVDHLGEIFGVLRRYHMKLNPLKCAFGVGLGKFLGFMEHLGRPPILSKPTPDEELSLYFSVSQHAVSSVLIREEERVQLPVYYVSKRLIDAESRYTEMEQLAFVLMVSNNEAEYEALIAGLRLENHLKNERLSIFSDSQLVVGQVNEEYQVRDEKIGAYLRKVKEELVKFKGYEILQIPRAENTNADALAKLASSRDSEKLGIVPIEELEQPTIEEKIEALAIHTDENWMMSLIQYLTDAKLQNDKDEARRIRYRATRYLLYDGLLYRRAYSMPLQQCLNDSEAQEVLREIHEGVCGNYTRGHSLAFKVLRQGFCDSLGIRKDFSAPIHPQSNGQVEAVNKIFKYTLKKKLNDLKGRWAEELPKVLWAYRTTSRTTTGETPFSMAYGVEAVLPVEIETPTVRTVVYNDDGNTEAMNGELDLLEEKRLDS